MKPSLDLRDLPLIRGSILLSLLLSMLGLGLVKVSHDGSTEMREILERLRSQRREIKEMQARLRSDEQEIRRTRLRYEEITKRGYLNREHRLEWVERIRKIREQRKLIEVNYELAPQQSVSNADGSGFEVMSSTMRLRMRLLHEEDLLNFLADLRGSVQAYLSIRSCIVERLPQIGELPTTAAGLQAECLIDWLTLRERK